MIIPFYRTFSRVPCPQRIMISFFEGQILLHLNLHKTKLENFATSRTRTIKHIFFGCCRRPNCFFHVFASRWYDSYGLVDAPLCAVFKASWDNIFLHFVLCETISAMIFCSARLWEFFIFLASRFVQVLAIFWLVLQAVAPCFCRIWWF